MAKRREKTRRPLAYIGLVVLLFFIGDRTLSFALGALVDQSEFRFSRLYRGELRYDVLIVGNSRAVHSIFAPDLSKGICQSVFNVAYNGMSAEIEEAIVRDYLDRNAPPKAVLIEVSNVLGDDDLLNDVRLYARNSPRLAEMIGREMPSAAFWMRISHLFAFNDELTLRALYYLHHGDQDWIIGNGAEMSPDLVHLRLSSYGQPQLRPAEAAALARLTAYLRRRQIQVILYVAPYHPVYQEFVPGNRVWREQLQQEIREPEIVDLSHRLTQNADFADLVHVNSKGGEAVTAIMAAKLRHSLRPDYATRCTPNDQTSVVER